MKKQLCKMTLAFSMGLLMLVSAMSLSACGGIGGGGSQIGRGHVDFLYWPSGDAYTKISSADVTGSEGAITVKVPNGYDMVNKGIELDLKKFFSANSGAWGKDLYFRRSDNSYGPNEVGHAYEIKQGTSNVWIRSGVTPEEVWTDNGGIMSSRLMLGKGTDGKILNYIFFGSPEITSKEVIYTIRTHDKKVYTLTVVVEKKSA